MSLLRQLCEDIKRSLVLGQRLHRPLVSSITVHPQLTPPPLWSDTDRSLRGLSTYAWPPVRKEPADAA